MKDVFGRNVTLPLIGDKVLRDGYEFSVEQVDKVDELEVIASIVLRGESGAVVVGYYDFLLHKKA
jgi:hypothetical protein